MAKATTPTAAASKTRPAAKTAAKPAAKSAAAKAPAKPRAVKPKKIEPASTTESLKDQASAYARTAGDKAREYANTGKDKATDALSGLSGFVDDLARTVDEKVGPQYGDYARKAAGAVAGVADALKDKDVDDLVEDTRKFIREKPAVAIGAAAAVGFVLMRLMKAGSGNKDA